MKIIHRNSLSIGVLIGTVIGILTDDIALWISLGLALGAAFKYKQKKQESEIN